MSYRPNWYQDDRPSGRFGGGWNRFTSRWGVLGTIVALNVVVWLCQLLGGPIVTDVLGLSAWELEPVRGGFGFEGEGPVRRVFNWAFPIQLFTYAVAHDPGSIFHILINTWWLVLFGRELEAAMGPRSFLRLYVGGALAGGLLYWFVRLVMLNPMPVVGASGAVLAVLVLYACMYPNRELILFPFPFPLRVSTLAVIYVLFNVYEWLSGTQGGVAVEAHLGGAAFGYLWYRKGDVVQGWTHARRREKQARGLADEEGERREMDRILAKIQTSGLSSLSDEERAFLARRSEQLRGRKS